MKSIEASEERGYSGPVRSLVCVLAAALCMLVAAGCGGGSVQTAGTPAPTTTETDASQPAPGREQAAAVEGTSLDGEPIALADFRGRAVLINVWSSW